MPSTSRSPETRAHLPHMPLDNPPSAPTPNPAYTSFWDNVGESFPSLKGAASTTYYFECERLLFEQYFPPLPGRTLFKTDLWDEAKNTEILRWAAEQGAKVYGIDIAGDIVHQARLKLKDLPHAFVVGDVRAIPFQDNSFDLVYSMGTIDHFPEYRTALHELFRILKPGGTAIIGVPNKADQFLRPLMVHILNIFGWYGYGMEKSFTPKELKSLLTSSGFTVKAQTGILFMPGWLRMADLLFHTRFPLFEPITQQLIKPFSWLYHRIPQLRRHGYLIACVAIKPCSLS